MLACSSLLDLLRRRAIVQRAAHVALQLVLLSQRREHGHRDQAAGFQVQPRSLPHVAPGVAGDVLLDRRGEFGDAAKCTRHKILAHDLLAGGETLLELGVGA